MDNNTLVDVAQTSEPLVSENTPDDIAAPSTAPADPDSETPEAEKPKTRAQERIEQLVLERNAARDEADQARRDERETLRRYMETQAQPAQNTPKDDPQPKLEDFDHDVGAFSDALVMWTERQVNSRASDAVKQELERQSKRQQEQSRKETFAERVAAFEAQTPDFSSVARRPDLPITNDMAEALMDSDKGAEILYHLGKNPSLAADISKKSPRQQAIAIGRLEGSVAQKPATKAPPPPADVSTVGATPKPLSDKMSTDDFIKARWKQVAAKQQN